MKRQRGAEFGAGQESQIECEEFKWSARVDFPRTATIGGLLLQNQDPEAAGQVKMSSRNIWTGRNICRGAAGEVEMSSSTPWSSWTDRIVVLEQRDWSKCRPGARPRVPKFRSARGLDRKCRLSFFVSKQLICETFGNNYEALRPL